MTATKRSATKLPSGTLQEWDRAVNERPLPNTDPNQTVLAGTGGPAVTRDELSEFMRENNARVARRRAGR